MKKVLQLSLLILAVISVSVIKPMKLGAGASKERQNMTALIQQYNVAKDKVDGFVPEPVYTKFKSDTQATIARLRAFRTEKAALAAADSFATQLTAIDAERQKAKKIHDFKALLIAELDKIQKYLKQNVYSLFGTGKDLQVIAVGVTKVSFENLAQGLKVIISGAEQKFGVDFAKVADAIDAAKVALGKLQQEYLAKSIQLIADQYYKNAQTIEKNLGNQIITNWTAKDLPLPLHIGQIYENGVVSGLDSYDKVKDDQNSKEAQAIKVAVAELAKQMTYFLKMENAYLSNVQQIDPALRLSLADLYFDGLVDDQQKRLMTEFGMSTAQQGPIVELLASNRQELEKLHAWSQLQGGKGFTPTVKTSAFTQPFVQPVIQSGQPSWPPKATTTPQAPTFSFASKSPLEDDLKSLGGRLKHLGLINKDMQSVQKVNEAQQLIDEFVKVLLEDMQNKFKDQNLIEKLKNAKNTHQQDFDEILTIFTDSLSTSISFGDAGLAYYRRAQLDAKDSQQLKNKLTGWSEAVRIYYGQYLSFRDQVVAGVEPRLAGLSEDITNQFGDITDLQIPVATGTAKVTATSTTGKPVYSTDLAIHAVRLMNDASTLLSQATSMKAGPSSLIMMQSNFRTFRDALKSIEFMTLDNTGLKSALIAVNKNPEDFANIFESLTKIFAESLNFVNAGIAYYKKTQNLKPQEYEDMKEMFKKASDSIHQLFIKYVKFNANVLGAPSESDLEPLFLEIKKQLTAIQQLATTGAGTTVTSFGSATKTFTNVGVSVTVAAIKPIPDASTGQELLERIYERINGLKPEVNKLTQVLVANQVDMLEINNIFYKLDHELEAINKAIKVDLISFYLGGLSASLTGGLANTEYQKFVDNFNNMKQLSLDILKTALEFHEAQKLQNLIVFDPAQKTQLKGIAAKVETFMVSYKSILQRRGDKQRSAALVTESMQLDGPGGIFSNIAHWK